MLKMGLSSKIFYFLSFKPNHQYDCNNDGCTNKITRIKRFKSRWNQRCSSIRKYSSNKNKSQNNKIVFQLIKTENTFQKSHDYANYKSN